MNNAKNGYKIEKKTPNHYMYIDIQMNVKSRQRQKTLLSKMFSISQLFVN